MSARGLIAILLLLGCAVPAGAAAPTDSTATRTAGASTMTPARTRVHGSATAAPGGTRKAAGAGAARATRKATSPRGSVAKGTAPAATTSAPQAGAKTPPASARTLEDIHIEGEIPVPQVLFITTRDQRRFVGFQHQRYIRSSRKVGEDTVVPSRVIVTDAATLPERSHSDD